MEALLVFILNSILLGVGLAMDAFSVSLANGLHEPFMRRRRMCLVAGVYAAFQFIMPLAGWFCVHTVVERFHFFERFIPWIAFFLLLYIGGSMILESRKEGEEAQTASSLTAGTLILQGIATSIDALSVGFTIEHYQFPAAFFCASIIAVVTFLLCLSGLHLGKQFGTRFSGKATLVGGVLLIGIGVEILIRGLFL